MEEFRIIGSRLLKDGFGDSVIATYIFMVLGFYWVTVP